MKMGEEGKFFPNLGAMDEENLEGAGKAAKNLADRRFTAFEGDIQMIIEMEMFDKDNIKQVKELKRDVGDNLTRYEDILTHLEALYSVKPEKYKAQLKEMKENFDMLSTRRSTVRGKSLEAVKAIEEERNKKEARDTRDDRTLTGAQGGSGGGDKQFKQPAGPHPEKISQEFTPLQADNWQADMKLYVKTCSNLQALSIRGPKDLDETLRVYSFVASRRAGQGR